MHSDLWCSELQNCPYHFNCYFLTIKVSLKFLSVGTYIILTTLSIDIKVFTKVFKCLSSKFLQMKYAYWNWNFKCNTVLEIKYTSRKPVTRIIKRSANKCEIFTTLNADVTFMQVKERNKISSTMQLMKKIILPN